MGQEGESGREGDLDRVAENWVPEGVRGLTAPRGGQHGRGSHCSEGWEERGMQVRTGAGGLEAGQVWGADWGGPG